MAMKEKFEQHTADIRAEVVKLSELSDREGQYVWEKFTTEGGESLGYVTADDENAYPDGTIQEDGYYYELLSNPVDLAKELDLIPQNIREGIDIFGVLGTMSEGVSGIDYGEITLSVKTAGTNYTIEHGLDAIPSAAYLIPKNEELFSISSNYMSGNINGRILRGNGSAIQISKTETTYIDKTRTSVTFKGSTNYHWMTGEYYWIVIA